MLAVFDGHNDALTREDHAGLARGRAGGHLDLPRMARGGMRGGIFAVFVETPGHVEAVVPREDGVVQWSYAPQLAQDVAAAEATRAAGRLFALQRADEVRVALTIADIDAARDGSGPPAAVLHLEGAEPIDPALEALDLWHAAGLRSLGPVWSRANAFAHGVPFLFPGTPDTGPGLTDAGRGLVRACAERGILVDLAHLNEAGFWDVAALEAGPLVVSHAAVHALAPTTRNLTDRQLDAIAASDGLIGIVFACSFLRADFAEDPDTPIALIAEHARYVAERIGVRHVALGSDFDGTTVPEAVGGADGLPRVLDALRDAGFSPDELEAVAWENWRRVLAAWWT